MFHRSKKSLIILTILTIAIVAAATLTAIATAFPNIFNSNSLSSSGKIVNSPSSFILTASGTAYDPIQGQTIQVGLSISGDARETPGSLVQLGVVTGAVSAKGYQTYSVSKGTGSISPQVKETHFDLTLASSPYSGKTSVWNLQGKDGTTVQNTIQITFTANSVKLPMDNSPVLKDLQLVGTITLK